jgi:hypothetical protein
MTPRARLHALIERLGLSGALDAPHSLYLDWLVEPGESLRAEELEGVRRDEVEIAAGDVVTLIGVKRQPEVTPQA